MNDLSCSAGPLGDQIVRGETAAPTGRNKDRARMDEDEVGGLDYKLLLLIQQNLSPKCWWNVVLQFWELAPTWVGGSQETKPHSSTDL